MDWDSEKEKRLTNVFYSFRQRGNRIFREKNEFFYWYKKNELNGCFYCGLTEKEQIKILKLESIDSKRFYYNLNGTRGRYLEVDRKIPENRDYSSENCVLSCYFCNNDKSDVFDEKQYKEFIGGEPRNNIRFNYFMSLLE